MTSLSMDDVGGLHPSSATSRTSRGCGGGGCCFGGSRGNQVEPLPRQHASYQLIEVRPNRHLCLHHINARSRDAEFEKKMKTYVKQHYYGREHRDVTVPPYQHDTAPVNKQEKCTPVTESVYHPNVPQSGDDVISPSHLSADVQSCETTLSNIEPTMGVGQKQAEGPLLFLLHGVGGSARVFQAQIDHFSAKGYEIVAPDLIGHGYSPGPRDKQAYLFEEILLDIFLIFDMCCKKDNVVIGHSYGASFASVLARRRPHLVQKLVMISGGAPTPLAPQTGIFSCCRCFLSCIEPILRRGFDKNAFHRKSAVEERGVAFSVPVYVLKYVMNGQAWAEGDPEYHRWISCPTMLLHGIDDQLISMEEELEMKESIYGCVLHVIDGASHMVMMEQPQRVNTLLDGFITAGSSRETTRLNDNNEISDSCRVTGAENADTDRSDRFVSPRLDVTHAASRHEEMTSGGHDVTSRDGAAIAKSPVSNGTVAMDPKVAKESVARGDSKLSNRLLSAHTRKSRVSLKSAKSIPNRLVSGNFMHKTS